MNKWLIFPLLFVLGGCSSVTPRIAEQSSTAKAVQVQPVAAKEPFVLVPTSAPVSPHRWINVGNRLAVSSMRRPRLAVECYNNKLVVRHDDLSEVNRDLSRSVFRIGNRLTVSIGDRYNNVYMDNDAYDNLVNQLYFAPVSTVVTITTDKEVTTQVGLLGYRSAVHEVFRECDYR